MLRLIITQGRTKNVRSVYSSSSLVNLRSKINLIIIIVIGILIFIKCQIHQTHFHFHLQMYAMCNVHCMSLLYPIIPPALMMNLYLCTSDLIPI